MSWYSGKPALCKVVFIRLEPLRALVVGYLCVPTQLSMGQCSVQVLALHQAFLLGCSSSRATSQLLITSVKVH